MAGKRKRKRSGQSNEGGQKRQRVSGNQDTSNLVVKNAILAKYYPQVCTLREYVLSKLPTTSKVRKRKIISVGKQPGDDADQKLSYFLDQTLVGVSKYKEVSQDERWKQWTTFSQKPADDSAFANLSGVGTFSQTEVCLLPIVLGMECCSLDVDTIQIVDFAIWLLFSKSHASNGRVQHLLCQGFRKDVSRLAVHHGETAGSTIPGVISTYPNSHVTSMKTRPWPQILMLLGREGERAMIDLILDCGIFLPVEGSHATFSQLSGEWSCTV